MLCVKLNHGTWKAISVSYQADVLMQTPACGTRKWVFGFQQVLDRQPTLCLALTQDTVQDTREVGDLVPSLKDH